MLKRVSTFRFLRLWTTRVLLRVFTRFIERLPINTDTVHLQITEVYEHHCKLVNRQRKSVDTL